MATFLNHLLSIRLNWIFAVVIFVTSIAGLYRPRLTANLALHPYSIRHHKEVYRLLSADLLHYDWIHLGINMYMLVVFGSQLEEELLLMNYGSLSFVVVYLTATLTAAIFVTIRHRNDFGYTSVGPSGSIMGCVFSVMILKPKMILIYIPVIGGISNVYSGLLYILITIWHSRRRGRINHELHVAGAIGGSAATVILTGRFFL